MGTKGTKIHLHDGVNYVPFFTIRSFRKPSFPELHYAEITCSEFYTVSARNVGSKVQILFTPIFRRLTFSGQLC